MSDHDRTRWDHKYAGRQPLARIEPDEWLVESLRIAGDRPDESHPPRRALDVACGLGHNAIYLAQQGWLVDGVDISTRALSLAGQAALVAGTPPNWIAADLDEWLPARHRYNLILVLRFLDRHTLPRIVETGLRPGGFLVYETFSSAQLARSDNHLRNPDFALTRGELEVMFPFIEVIEQRGVELADRTVRRWLGRRDN